MPRATRKALAEDAPSRSSPRASTRASTAAASSPVPAPPRGRRGKAEEPEPSAAVETKSRGRSTSRAKAAAATPKPAPAARQSRSRGRNAAADTKTTPTPPKRGRGKAKKEEPEEEEDVEEEEVVEEEEEEEEEVTPKRGKGRSQSKTKTPPAKKATPPARGSRGSRRSAEAAPEEEEEKEEPKKTTRRSRGKASPASAPPARSRRGRGAGEAEEEKEEEAKEEEEEEEAEEEKTEESGEAKKQEEMKQAPEEKEVEMKQVEAPKEKEEEMKPDKAPKEKEVEIKQDETPKEKEIEAEKMETSAEEAPTGVKSQEEEKAQEKRATAAAETEDKPEPAEEVEEEKDEPDSKMETEAVTEKQSETADKDEPAAPAERKEAAEDKTETDSPAKAIEAAETKDAVQVQVPAEDASEAANAEEKMEAEAPGGEKSEIDSAEPTEEKASIPCEEPAQVSVPEEEPAQVSAPEEEEPMEEEAPAPPAPQPTADSKNGDVDDAQPPHKPGTKRKFEEDDVEEIDESVYKRARINGMEAESAVDSASADVEMEEPKPAAAAVEDDSSLVKDFVVVNKEDVPASDSAEVAAALPRHVEESKSSEASAGKVGEGGSVEPVRVIPLTEAELAKAYASDVKNLELGETDEVSSTIVEVGSVAGSDITGGLSRGLDISELQSASNSVDGDFAADSSMNESTSVPEVCAEFLPPAPTQQTRSESPAKAADPSALPTSCPPPDVTQTDATVPEVSQKDATAPEMKQTSVPNDANTVPADDQTAASTEVHQNDTSSQQASSIVSTSMDTDSATVQNSHPDPPVAKGSGSVTDDLGTPDPTFLAKYSSPGILNRVFVDNPAKPTDSVSPNNRFSVVSYNILAECHRKNSQYKTAPEFLGQEYRHNLLMKELLYLNGDIVCLQEVGPDYFNNTLLPAMTKLGYEGLMKRRTQDYFDEGEATFYKTSLFELEASKGVSLTEVAHKQVETGRLSTEVAAAINKYLDRADVVLITRLRSKVTGKVITVGNIHVVWDFMSSPDVQCIQAACAVKEVVGMSGSEGAHIVCGDFNAEWSSPVYQLVLDGYLSDSSIHTLQAVQKLELNDGAKSLVNHLWRAFQHTSSNLKSAYSTITKSEPEITTLTAHSRKAVDYVFYSAGSLVPLGILKTVDAAIVDATGQLPAKDFPSDHLAIKTLMAFCK